MIGSITAQSTVSIQRDVVGATSRVGASDSKVKKVDGLTEEEKKTVSELKKRDLEVRAHEQAHKTAGGPYASAPTFETVTGPDGREYAVSGEVKIDSGAISGNPEATIRKMEVVVRAALAPAEPSSQDMQVAAQAQAIKLQAQSDLRAENEKKLEEGSSNDENKAPFQILSNLLEQAQETISEIKEVLIDIQA